MESVAAYKKAALSMSCDAFSDRFPHPFLIKHPRTRVSVLKREGAPTFDFATQATDMNFDPFPDRLQVVPVVKRPGNPFPDRLTIGRAPNCDLLVRLPLISKVHAHLLIQPGGGYALRDNKASNGTFHNRRRLEPGGQREVRFGDTLGFGSLDLVLSHARDFYSLLQDYRGPS